mgnify:CR=1 FL=1
MATDIKVYKIKSRSKQGWKDWAVDARRAVVGGKREYYATKDDAIARRNELLGVGVASGQSKTTFADAADHRVGVYKGRYELGNIKFTTAKDAGESRNFWNRFFGGYELNDITPDIIRNSINELLEFNPNTSKPAAPKTIKNRYTFLNGVFKYAVGDKLCSYNPCDSINLVELIGSTKATKHLAERYSKRIIAEIITYGGRYAMHIKFAVKTGLRSGEQRGVQWHHIDFDAGFVTVEQAIVLGPNGLEIGEPKSPAAYRNVPLSDEMLQDLREWRLQSKYSKDTDFVFPADDGGPLWAHQLNGELQKRIDGGVKYKGGLKPACHRAGVEMIRWHDLRHHYASLQLYRDGVQLNEVAALMGHETSKITEEIYGHWLEGATKDQDLRRRAAV